MRMQPLLRSLIERPPELVLVGCGVPSGPVKTRSGRKKGVGVAEGSLVDPELLLRDEESEEDDDEESLVLDGFGVEESRTEGGVVTAGPNRGGRTFCGVGVADGSLVDPELLLRDEESEDDESLGLEVGRGVPDSKRRFALKN